MMVSIIVPVYNVYEYIDRCMQSIVEQTYKDIEIILINDGSTDGSDKKCEEWAGNDSRIRYISKENEGLGPTRNLGVSEAKSDYIMFVDSDDWVDVTIVEKLMDKLLDANADIVACDRYDVKVQSDSYSLVIQDMEEIVELSENPEVITQISTSQWGKIFKKDLFLINKIEQPKHFYEDAVTPVLIAMSKKVCYVNEPLYYYVVDRGGSITNNVTGLDQMINYLETVVNLFKKYNLFERYNENLLELCINRICWNVYHADCVLKSKMDEICALNEAFIRRYWNEECDIKKALEARALENQFYIWGSYNLMTAMKIIMMMNTPRCPQNHYAFSSLISAMNKRNSKLNMIAITHDSEFRKDHLLKEFKRDFVHKNLGEFEKANYLVIDFLEERFDIGEYKGEFFTISDAFKDLEFKGEYRRLDRTDENVKLIWKKNCKKYINLIRKYFKGKRIFLVKMLLSETFGDLEKRVKFKNYKEIRKINEYLESCYNYFIENCPEAEVIELAGSQYYYTDEKYRHGCYPWHLNEYMYREIKEKLVEAIWEK